VAKETYKKTFEGTHLLGSEMPVSISQEAATVILAAYLQ
jgi:hypothetical protein